MLCAVFATESGIIFCLFVYFDDGGEKNAYHSGWKWICSDAFGRRLSKGYLISSGILLRTAHWPGWKILYISFVEWNYDCHHCSFVDVVCVCCCHHNGALDLHFIYYIYFCN